MYGITEAICHNICRVIFSLSVTQTRIRGILEVIRRDTCRVVREELSSRVTRIRMHGITEAIHRDVCVE